MPTNIVIERDAYTIITRHRDPNDRWDSNDESTTHTITGFRVVGEKDYGDLVVSFTPQADRDYYLLFVTYETGDSFSRSEGMLQLLDLYENREAAEANAKAIQQHYDARHDSDDRYDVPIVYENGTKGTIFASWVGYFERLQSVSVQPVRLAVRSKG